MKRSHHLRYLLLIILLLLAYALRVNNLGNQSLWWDELKTLERATLPIKDMLVDLISKRNHMPLYFFIMRSWVLFTGQSAFTLRYFSLVWGLLSVAEMYRLGRMIGGQAVAVVSALLMAVAPFHVWYSQEARMYTMLPFALLVANDFFLQALRNRNRFYWVGYGIAMLSATYIHYFALFIFAAHYAFFALHIRQLRQAAVRWFIVTAAVGGLTIIWMGVVAGTSGYAESVPGWIGKISWLDPLLTIWNFSSGFGLLPMDILGLGLVILYGLAFLISLSLLRHNTPRGHVFRLLFLWFIVPFTITFFVSLDWRTTIQSDFSFYMDRYLIIIMPPFLLLTAWGLVSLACGRNKLLVSLMAFVFVVTFTSQFSFHNKPEYARKDWLNAFAHIKQFAAPGDIIVGQENVLLPFHYYQDEDIPFLQIPAPDGDTITAAYDQVMTERLEVLQRNANRMWLVDVFYNNNPHNFPDSYTANVVKGSSTTQNWFEERLTLRGSWQFPGIRLTIYDLLEKDEMQDATH